MTDDRKDEIMAETNGPASDAKLDAKRSHHPFSKDAVEAAAKALYREACRQRDYFDDTDEIWQVVEFRESCIAGMNVSLSAALEHARGEGNVKNGTCESYNYRRRSAELVWSDHVEWNATTSESVQRNFPVAIIKDAKE